MRRDQAVSSMTDWTKLPVKDLARVNRRSRQGAHRDDVHADHLIFGAQQGHHELLPVRLASGENEVLKHGVGLMRVAQVGLAKGDGFVFDQGYAVDGDTLLGNGLALLICVWGESVTVFILFHTRPP